MAGAIANDTEKADTAPDAVVPEKGREIVAAADGAVIESSAAVADGKALAEIPQECLIKHPLHNTWTLWYLENDRHKTWEDMQNKITAFDTVEDFWSLYNHIRVASEIGAGNDYSLFKRNIRPMWEDETNKRGGRWLIVLQRNHRRIVDVLWLDIVLCLIGEAFDDSEDICGAVVNIRPRGDKIAVWTADGTNKQSIMNIGKKIQSSIRLPPDANLIYELHSASANKGSKPLYTLNQQ